MEKEDTGWSGHGGHTDPNNAKKLNVLSLQVTPMSQVWVASFHQQAWSPWLLKSKIKKKKLLSNPKKIFLKLPRII